MDVLSIIGLTLALGAILFGQWVEGGSMASLVQLAAFFIVIGGTLGAVMLQTPSRLLARAAPCAVDFRRRLVDHQAAIAQLAGWADTSRRDGMLALENQLDAIADPFTRNGLQMLVDGYEPERIREAMHIDINYYENRQKTAAQVWESAGGYAPTVGIIGAVWASST